MNGSDFRQHPAWKELQAIIRQRCFLQGRFVLKSGQVSNYYFDCRLVTLHSRGSLLIADLILELLQRLERESGRRVEAVGGPTMGADPIAAAVALRSGQLGRPVEAFIVRREAKQHGTSQHLENHPGPGAGVAIVEDVVTTGGSVLQAAELAEAAGLDVLAVICIVDREQGGGEALAVRWPYHALFRRSDFEPLG
jgi:orotate phosphoribosyltransferase